MRYMKFQRGERYFAPTSSASRARSRHYSNYLNTFVSLRSITPRAIVMVVAFNREVLRRGVPERNASGNARGGATSACASSRRRREPRAAGRRLRRRDFYGGTIFVRPRTHETEAQSRCVLRYWCREVTGGLLTCVR